MVYILMSSPPLLLELVLVLVLVLVQRLPQSPQLWCRRNVRDTVRSALPQPDKHHSSETAFHGQYRHQFTTAR
jgi:hypothetical protein